MGGHQSASYVGGNNGQSPLRHPRVAGLSRDRQSWWTALLHSQYQMPLMTVVSLSRSTTRTERAEPQPQHIARNWWARVSLMNGGVACIVSVAFSSLRRGCGLASGV